LRLVLALSFCYVALAQQTATFTPTSSMVTPRFLHTATLLLDGRVLIAGGERIEGRTVPPNFKVLATAEVYDPLTGTFIPTGEMATPRTRYSATLLPDGKVLAGGGLGDNQKPLANAELYDPNTGRFVGTGNMTTPRVGHTAILLNNGKVLIAGGGIGSNSLAAELYDPSTGSFTATGNMNRPFADTSTLLPNGTVLITRGNPEGPGPYLSSAELYDPVTGTFAFAGYLRDNHTGPTAVLLTDGNVLVAGGDIGDGDGASYVAELFDPGIGTFVATGRMTRGRDQNTSTLLRDGSVLLAGGHTVYSASAELYDPVQGSFSITGDMTTRREIHTTTLLNDGRVLIAGGDDQRYWVPDTILSSAELYVPSVLIPAPVITDFQFDRSTVVAGTSYSANVSGTNLAPQTFFDVRFRSPESSESAVVLNWQKGVAVSHDVPVGIATGVWTINGVRAHQIETDHTGIFFPVSATITVSPILISTPVVETFRFDRVVVPAGSSYSVDLSGSNLTPKMFFDVRFISPESSESAVALNWQRGLFASHDVPASIARGSWKITGVRAHEIETDHSGDFFSVSATITVSP